MSENFDNIPFDENLFFEEPTLALVNESSPQTNSNQPVQTTTKTTTFKQQAYKTIKTIIIVSVSFLIGYTLAILTLTPNHTNNTVKKIISKDTILSRIDTMRDDQLQAIQKELSTLNNNNSDKIKPSDKAILVDKATNNVKTIDEFFTKLLNETTDTTQLAQYFEKGENNPNINKILKDNTIAKTIKQTGKKVGSTHLLLDTISNSEDISYTVLVPYAIEDHLLTGIYNLSVTKDNKIIDIYYVGFFDNQKDKTYFDTLNKIREFKKP